MTALHQHGDAGNRDALPRVLGTYQVFEAKEEIDSMTVYPEQVVTALTPASTAMRNGDSILDQHQRLMELECENSCLKQAMSELMMEKVLLKVALESRYQTAPTPQESVLTLTYEAARNASQRARSASVYVEPGILGTQLRATYGDLMDVPVSDAIAEFMKQLKRKETPFIQSLTGHVLSALAPMRFGRSGR